MSVTVRLTPAATEQLAQRTATLLAERLAVLREPSPTCTTADVQHLLQCKSSSALHRLTAELGIVPYAQGRYRRVDVLNAIGRCALNAAKVQKQKSVGPLAKAA